MALRQIDIYLPNEASSLPSIEEDFSILGRWDFEVSDRRRFVRILLKTRHTDAFLEWLEKQLAEEEDYRIVVKSVEATIPHPSEGEDNDDESPEDAKNEIALDADDDDDDDDEKSVARISRQEVYQDVEDSISVTTVYYALVLLSTIVATGGMMRDSTAVVIGAMVIAPLIGPNIALALGTTLADMSLLKRALKVNLLGLLMGLAFTIVAGALLPFDPTVSEIASRTEVNIADVALALAAGAAGVLSVTRGVSAALIGVMVAVALLPPLVALGLHLGIGDWAGAYGAGLLTLTNVVAINIAGVITFLVQGIRPTTWYEEEKAKKTRAIALVLWLVILGLLVAAIILG